MLAIISLATDLTKMDYFSWTLLEAKRELFYVIVVVGYQDAFRITNSKKEAIMNLLLLLLEPTYFLFVCCSIVLYSIYTTIMMYWRLRSVTYFDK